MQNEQSQIIVRRFFEAIQRLIDEGTLNGKKTFCDRYNINRWNFITCSREPQRDIFQAAWLYYLVKDYNVSAEWLLTGEGEMYRKRRGRKRKTCKLPASQIFDNV